MPEKKGGIFHKNYIAAVCLCIAFLASSLLFLLIMMQKNEEENLQYLQNAAQQKRATLLKQVAGDFQTLEGIAVCIGESGLNDVEQIVHILKKINDKSTFIRMGVADMDGNLDLVDIGGGRHQEFNIANRDFFLQALSGKESISTTLPDSLVPGSYINYYAVRIQDREGNVTGVLCAVNSAEMFGNIVDDPILNGSGYSSIINNKGTFVIRSRNQALSDTTAFGLEDLSGLDGDVLAQIKECLTAGECSLSFSYTVQGAEQLGVILPLGVNDWFVFSSIPKQALKERYSQTVAGVSAIILVACAIFLFFFYRQRRMMARNQEMLVHLAYDDSLTGCRNFEKFLLDAEPFLRSRDKSFAVWYCDLKKFKFFNDIFGYQRGDQVLCWMADLFSQLAGEDDLFCRMAADNFVGIRAYENKEELDRWFQALLGNLRGRENPSSSRMSIEMCMGFYCVDTAEQKLPLNDMVNRANMAQKSVKGKPGSRFAFFTNEIRLHSLMESEMEAQGRLAVENGQFMVYVQPKVDIQRGNVITGAEVLTRWRHPEKGLIPPGQFVSLFEKNGVIVDLDRYMFEKVCQWLRDYLDAGRPIINLAVNVSRLGLLQEDFIDHYAAVKEKYLIPDGVLELEFTESVFLDDDNMFFSTVQQLKSHGFICSLDDFGSGYSSLNLLKNLPIDVLKLDILFFRKSACLERERIVISNIVHMARQLDIKTIAEGVEAAEQVDFLRGTGCNTVQGYVFARPMPLEDFDALLKKTEGAPLTPLQ